MTTKEFELTVDEFAQSLAPYLGRGDRRMIWVAIICTVCGIVNLLTQSPTTASFVPWVGVYLVIYGIILIPLQRYGRRKRLAKIYKDSAPGRQVGVMRFDESGVASHNPLGESTMRWPAYSHFLETDSLFILFQGPAVPVAVPKRALASSEDEAQLRALLQQHIGRSTYEPVKGFQVLPAPAN